jgi:electron transport complex protein RnfG
MATPGGEVPARRAVRSALVLAVAAILAVGLVALVNDRARPQIEASRRAAQLQQLTAVMGEVAYDNDPLTDTVLVHDLEYLGTTEPLVAQGRLIGVRVLEHRETPGLGDFVEERRTDWIHQFTGRSLEETPAARWQVRKDGGDFDQYTGATVTSRAVTHAVRDSLAYFARHREELLAAAPPPAAP